MAIRDIHLLGSPILRRQSAAVAEVDAEVRQLVDDLFETMDAAKGVGLAANQVGEGRRVAVVGVEDTRIAMINPVIASAEGRTRQEEGCLSIPEVYGEVVRAARIVLGALDREGQPYRLEAAGLLARAIQHEVDHLDGILFLDHLSALKRQFLTTKYRKEHRGEPLIKPVRVEAAERK